MGGVREAKPFHVGTINGHPVRFFGSPLEGPDLPWHAIADLHAALGLPEEASDDLMSRTMQRWRDEVRTVDAGADRVVIGPNFMALGLVEAFAELLPAGPALLREYARAGAAAVDAMLADLPPMERLQYMLRAARRHGTEGE